MKNSNRIMANTLYFSNNREGRRCCAACGAVKVPLLVCAVFGSFTIAAATVLSLESDDRISLRRGACLMLLGFIFFISLFDLLNHFSLKTSYGTKFRKKYQLSVADVVDISNKLVSVIQALLSCLAGVVVCAWSCARSFLNTSHFMSEAYAWFGAAYFFYDIWSMYKVYIVSSLLTDNNCAILNTNGKGPKSAVTQKTNSIKNYIREQPVIIMHHLFIGSFGFLIVVYLRGGLGDCIFGYVYLMELSTPFVSARSILSRLRLKASKLYVINGIVMLITFFLCRIVMFPYVLHVYSKVVDLPFIEAIMSLPKNCKIGIAIMLLPQMYWFYLMVIGAFKTFNTTEKRSNLLSNKKRRSIPPTTATTMPIQTTITTLRPTLRS